MHSVGTGFSPLPQNDDDLDTREERTGAESTSLAGVCNGWQANDRRDQTQSFSELSMLLPLKAKAALTLMPVVIRPPSRTNQRPCSVGFYYRGGKGCG